jgi:hypothetical protein
MISESRRLVTGFFTGRKTCRFRLMASCKKDGGEGAIGSQKDILGPASCRKQYANVAKNATVATPHCPVLPAGHDLLTWAPLGRTRNREPVLRLRQASSNSCSDCARSVRLWSPAIFFRGPGRTNLHLAVAKTKAITERVNTEFRAGAFNMFNHTEFARKRRRGMGSLPSSQGLLEEVGGLSWRTL